MRRMRRLAAVLVVLGMGLWAQGLRYRVECQAAGGGVVEDCSGEVLVSGGMSLWREKTKAILIRPAGAGREAVEMDWGQKTWDASALPAMDALWKEFRGQHGYWRDHEVRIESWKVAEERRVGSTVWHGFVLDWKSSRPPRPIRYKPGEVPRSGTPGWIEENTRELGIRIETWVNPAIRMPGLGWERVGWGEPETHMQQFVALFAARSDVRDLFGDYVGLAMETKIRYRIMGQESEVTIRVVDVKEGAIEAKEFAIPEGFRELK